MSNAIEVRGVTKRYSTFTLGPLDLTVPRGAIYGLIGPNGAGKTTLLDLMFGMGRNDSGEIKVLGFDHQAGEVEVKRRAAYVSPELNYQTWRKVGDAVRFVRGFFPGWDDGYCAELMSAFELSDSERTAALSFGARTKLNLLLALARRPEVLILDEPTTGLDAVSRRQVFAELLKVVKEGDRTVLIASHALHDVERFTDHVGMIQQGKLLLEGRTDEVVDRYRFAEFFTPEGSDLTTGDGLTVLRRQENRWQALLDMRSAAPARLPRHGAERLSLTPVTLEDLFVALATEKEAQ